MSKRHTFRSHLKHAVNSFRESLSDSAKFDVTSNIGGAFEEARRILQRIKTANFAVHRVNLETGDLEPEILTEEKNSIGDILFNYALMVLKTPNGIHRAKRIRPSVVDENGKFRVITVSDIMHVMALQPISHFLLTVLGSLPSSRSGVKAADHCWNFFKRLNPDNPEINNILQICNVLSTDFETATDYLQFLTTRAILRETLRFFSIGRWYTDVIIRLLTTPRVVYGTSYREWSNETKKMEVIEIPTFATRSGMLMGDPITKFTLHMVHLIARDLAIQEISSKEDTKVL
jgi:hypothetical protein